MTITKVWQTTMAHILLTTITDNFYLGDSDSKKNLPSDSKTGKPAKRPLPRIPFRPNKGKQVYFVTVKEKFTTIVYETVYLKEPVTETVTTTIGSYKRNRKCLPNLPFHKGGSGDDDEDYDEEDIDENDTEEDEYYNIVYDTVTETETVTTILTAEPAHPYNKYNAVAKPTGIQRQQQYPEKKFVQKGPGECDCSSFNREALKNSAANENQKYVEHAILGTICALIMTIVGSMINTWFY